MSFTHVRKPYFVEARQVTEENMLDVAFWCEGDVVAGVLKSQTETYEYIKIRAGRSYSLACIGDYVLKADIGFKVYSKEEFEEAFDRTTGPDDDIHPDWLIADASVNPAPGAFSKAICENVVNTWNHEPCVLYQGHWTGENPTACRSAENPLDTRTRRVFSAEQVDLERVEGHTRLSESK